MAADRSTRDYFLAHVLQGLLSDFPRYGVAEDEQAFVKRAFDITETVLQERAKRDAVAAAKPTEPGMKCVVFDCKRAATCVGDRKDTGFCSMDCARRFYGVRFDEIAFDDI